MSIIHSECEHELGEEGRDAVTVGEGGVMNGKFWARLDIVQKQRAHKGLTCSSIFDQPSSFLSERGGKEKVRWEGRRERVCGEFKIVFQWKSPSMVS